MISLVMYGLLGRTRRRDSAVVGSWDQVTDGVVAERYATHGRLFRILNWLPPLYRRKAAQVVCWRKGMIVVELGSGWGANATNLNDLVGPGGKVYAVELARESHEHAEQKYYCLNRVCFVNENAFRFALPEHASGFLFSLSYCTMPEQERRVVLLQKLWDMLPSGGRIVILDARLKPGSMWEWTLPLWDLLMQRSLLGNPRVNPCDELKLVKGVSKVAFKQLGFVHYICYVEKS